MPDLGFTRVLTASLLMSFRVVALALGGYCLVRRKVIDKPVARKLGGIIVDLLTPCLIFGKIVTNFRIENWRSWVPVFLLTYLSVMLGIATGYLLAIVLNIKKKSERRLMGVLTGFAHTGSIQLTLAVTLQSTLNELGGVPECDPAYYDGICPSDKALSYIVLVWVLTATLRWSIGYSMLVPVPEEQQHSIASFRAGSIQSGHPSSYGNQNPPQKSYIQKWKETSDDACEVEIQDLNAPLLEQEAPKIHVLTCKEKCNKTLNPPVLTSLVAITVASIPYVNDLFRDKDSIIFQTITSTSSFIGTANYIMMIILLGANLSIFKKEKTAIPIKVHWFLTFFRLVVYPIFGIAILYFGLHRTGTIQDSMMVFVLLLTFATPPANNLMIMATMNQNHEADMATNLFMGYISSIFTLTLYVALFLYLIQL